MSRAMIHCKSRNQHGFALAPILYLLGLIGVLAGVMFSGQSQILRTTQTVQNNITVKSDLQAAANTLSAQGVFSVDGLTLCPPRSTHQTNGDPCTAAPVSLIQFGDYTGNQLPANYASAATTGSPTEVGVFAAGSGVKVLDPWGHTYIYCRWENPRSSPASPAFVLLSAGANGNLQTKCGDSSAQGDDSYLSLSVATAINRAALWQANGTSNITYGATGSQVTIDNSGDLTAVGTSTLATLNAGNTTLNSLSVTGSTTLNSGLSVLNGDLDLGNSYSFAQLDSTGVARRLIALSPTNDVLLGGHNGTQNIYFLTNNSTVGWFNVNGDFDAYGSVYTTNVNASNTVYGNTGSFTNLNTTSASVTGTLTVGTVNTNSSVTIGGGLNVNGGDITLGNGNSYAELDNGGNARRLMALDGSNNLLIGGRGGTQGITFYGNGSQLANIDTSGDLTLTGNLTGANATFSGTVTASNFVGTLNIGTSGGSNISGVVPLANGGTGTAASGVSNLLNSLFSNDSLPSVTLPVGRLPALTGDVVKSAASSATSLTAIQGTAITGVSGSGAVMLATSPTTTGTLHGVNADFTGAIGIGTSSPAAALQIIGNYEGGNNIFTVNVGQNQGLNVDQWGNVDAYFLYVGSIATGWDDNVSTFAISSEDGSDLYLTTDSTGTGNNNILLIPQGTGKVGIGTTKPQATLDVNGYAKLVAQTAAPATCTGTNKGAFAMTTHNGLCFCNGSAWNKVESPATACAW